MGSDTLDACEQRRILRPVPRLISFLMGLEPRLIILTEVVGGLFESAAKNLGYPYLDISTGSGSDIVSDEDKISVQKTKRSLAS